MEYAPWHDLGGWVRYMAPKGDFLGDRRRRRRRVPVSRRGGRGERLAAERPQRAHRERHVTRLGDGPYKAGFSDPIRFGAILDDALKRVGATHVRRLSSSRGAPGYAAMGIALGNAHYYALADTAIVLDGLHADLIDGKPDERADCHLRALRARRGRRARRRWSSSTPSIVPPGYASTTQMADLLCASVGARRIEEERLREDGLVEWYHADAGGLHVRGFRGGGPRTTWTSCISSTISSASDCDRALDAARPPGRSGVPRRRAPARNRNELQVALTAMLFG